MLKPIYGLHAVRAILKNHPENIDVLYVFENRQDKRLAEIIALAKQKAVLLKAVKREVLDKLAQNGIHQGVVAQTFSTNVKNLEEYELPAWLNENQDCTCILALDQVQDPHNLGACLRTADAAGVKLVLIPKDQACNVTALVRKVACGAAENVLVVTVTNLSRTLQALQEQGFWIYGLTDQAEQDLFSTHFAEKVVMVLGAEGKGLRRLTLENCDVKLRIPMLGTVESLNVSVACGLALYEVLRQRVKA